MHSSHSKKNIPNIRHRRLCNVSGDGFIESAVLPFFKKSFSSISFYIFLQKRIHKCTAGFRRFTFVHIGTDFVKFPFYSSITNCRATYVYMYKYYKHFDILFLSYIISLQFGNFPQSSAERPEIQNIGVITSCSRLQFLHLLYLITWIDDDMFKGTRCQLIITFNIWILSLQTYYHLLLARLHAHHLI